MIAVIEFKGKQYRVEPQQVIRALRVEGEKGDTVQVQRVLATIDGSKVAIGQPVLEGASVSLEILRQAKSPKIHVFTYQPKKRVSRRKGYREKITYLRVAEIKG